MEEQKLGFYENVNVHLGSIFLFVHSAMSQLAEIFAMSGEHCCQLASKGCVLFENVEESGREIELEGE